MILEELKKVLFTLTKTLCLNTSGKEPMSIKQIMPIINFPNHHYHHYHPSTTWVDGDIHGDFLPITTIRYRWTQVPGIKS